MDADRAAAPAPYAGWHALPGGFLGIDESLDDAAARVLAAKAGLSGVWLEQLYTFGQPRRDPRTRVLSVAYFALVDGARLEAVAQAGGGVGLARVSVPWAGETGGPVSLLAARGSRLRLAFDHAAILGMAVSACAASWTTHRWASRCSRRASPCSTCSACTRQ
ncbi:MAG: NUDIX domain-containing protein [Polyangiaceae bacterium]